MTKARSSVGSSGATSQSVPVHPVQMSEQAGRDPQGLKDDNADVMEDAHHITMQPIRPDSIAL
ncbi:hypothetical protein N0Q90_30920 (plasmid) [Sinorhizobium sp. M103]|uniref:hypothetical protein n=1 Tax=Sinorhizobium sp. M103 TaxID=2976821 RepID=UPI0023D8183B|nr:hypothetical protein [Sinorhizobium sp. M103]WEJ12965.1 hypothetical protein N0Q90_30920 [Sinorhizobium sp. M103]